MNNLSNNQNSNLTRNLTRNLNSSNITNNITRILPRNEKNITVIIKKKSNDTLISKTIDKKINHQTEVLINFVELENLDENSTKSLKIEENQTQNFDQYQNQNQIKKDNKTAFSNGKQPPEKKREANVRIIN